MLKKLVLILLTATCLFMSGCSSKNVYKNNTDQITLNSDGTFIYEWLSSDAFYEGTYENGGNVYVLHFENGDEYTLFVTDEGNLASNNGITYYKA